MFGLEPKDMSSDITNSSLIGSIGGFVMGKTLFKEYDLKVLNPYKKRIDIGVSNGEPMGSAQS